MLKLQPHQAAEIQVKAVLEDSLLKLPEEIPVKALLEDSLLTCHPVKQVKEVRLREMAEATRQVQVM
jgi:hypothetical protein